MDSTQFVTRLKELGISINIQKLRRWSKQGLIPDYETYYQPKQKKRGRPPNPVKAEKEGRILEKARLGRVSKWPKEALEEAAAVWAVRYISNDDRSDGIKVTAEAIELIRRVAAMLDKSPCAIYMLPPITGPLSTRHIVPEDIEINFVSEDFEGLNLLAGTDNAKKADRLNTLVITWITAIEKVRAWEAAGMQASITERHPELGGLMPAEIDFRQIDLWQVPVSCPWQITKPARVRLFWWSRPSNNKNGSRKFWRPPFPWQRDLCESDRDEVVLYENFVDTREFFKIRGRLVQEETSRGTKRTFKTGLSEFNISRAKAAIQILPQDALFDSLNLAFPPTCDLAVTQSSDHTSFDILIDRLGINLITGMKGSGKSYLAKRLLLKLIDNHVLTIVFDLNAEYLNLRKADDSTPSRYADRMITFTPYLAEESDSERVLMIPIHEITYDDFAAFVNVPRESAMYLYLIQFWRQNSDIAFTLEDLERFVKTIDNEFARAGLLVRVEVARTSGLFGPNAVTGFIKAMQKGGGAIIFNLSEIPHWERMIAVEFVLRRLVRLGQAREFEAVSLFLEEAQLYVEPQNMIDIVTRMRHSGIFPTFITNTPRTLPDDVFTLLDNLIAFSFRNDDELRQLARSGLIDQKSINALQHLEKQQCIAVGKITSQYPLFVEIQPQTGVLMGGETRRLL